MAARYHIVTPNADTSAVEAAVGFTIATPVYTISDPIPRTQTHSLANVPSTPALAAAIETAITGARALFPNSDFTVYDGRTEPKVPADQLLALGLTKDPNA